MDNEIGTSLVSYPDHNTSTNLPFLRQGFWSFTKGCSREGKQSGI